MENRYEIIYRNEKNEYLRTAEEVLNAAEAGELNVYANIPTNVPLDSFTDEVSKRFPIEEGYLMSLPTCKELPNSTGLYVTIKKRLDFGQDKPNVLS